MLAIMASIRLLTKRGLSTEQDALRVFGSSAHIALCDTCVRAIDAFFAHLINQLQATSCPGFWADQNRVVLEIRSMDGKRNKETEAQVPRSLE